ncbi:MAG: radical SAM protein, partial [Dactylosporangium sp.]|nr:radical SAM protein [Dactylosporangium sp.]NNJ59811.1 radical SAM protein [Dactylosporangium sp.]
MPELIASPFLDEFLLLHPGHRRGIRMPQTRFAALATTDPREPVPDWLVATAETSWRLRLTGRRFGETVLVRRPCAGYAWASWEITLGCNWACPHCYLGPKQPCGLDWTGKRRLLGLLAEAGVLWLQITGGEPTLDPDFSAAYTLACQLGMMVTVSTNASTLAKPWLLDLFTRHRPYRIAVSLYGADPSTYQRVTGRAGTWVTARRGIDAALGAGLPLRANLIVTSANADQVPA